MAATPRHIAFATDFNGGFFDARCFFFGGVWIVAVGGFGGNVSTVFDDDFIGGFGSKGFFFVNRLTGCAGLRILRSVGTMPRTADRPRRASDRRTRIMRTNTIFTVLTAMTSAIGTTLLADPFAAGLIGPTTALIIACIFLAFVVFANFIHRTITRFDALAFAAVFAICASDSSAGIGCTLSIDALFPGFTTIRITIRRNTPTPPTKLIVRAFHTYAKILTSAIFAQITIWTSDIRTGFPDTVALFARLTLRTLTIATFGATA